MGTDPTAVVALAFDTLPYPAVVALDSLRDDAGVAQPLRASAINSDGNEIPDAPIRYLSLDPGVSVSDDGFVISTDLSVGSARVVAQVGDLQSRPLTVVVTVAPDSAVRDGTIDTLRYELANPASNVSSGITLRVLSNAVTPPANVRGWIVRYSISFRGAPVAPTDTTLAWMVDEGGRRSAVDTTATDGRASRRLRLVPTGLGAVADDSLLVTATVQAYGQPLTGTPVQATIHVRPRL